MLRPLMRCAAESGNERSSWKRGADLRMPGGVVLVSCVLFTLALLMPMPNCVEAARANWNVSFQHEGFACLTISLVGLLVTWTGFRKRIRWAWWVMFVITWVGVFPTRVLPLFQHKWALTPKEWIYSALFESGLPRFWAVSVVIFVLMLISLLLTAKSFFGTQNRASTHTV